MIDDSARAAFEKEYRDVFSEWEGYEYGSDDFRQATAKMKAMEDSHPDWTEEITNADPSFDKAWLKKMRPQTASDVGESAPSQKVPCRPTFVKRWSAAEPLRAFMDFISIPAGSFTMASPKTEEDRWSDEKQMEVTITRAFELGKTVVTQKQWTEVMGTNPWNRGRKEETGDNYPAVYVSWDDASHFFEHLTSYEREAA